MAVYTHLGASELAQFLSHYDAGSLVSAKGIAEGVSNSNYLIETTKARYILTLYEERTDSEDLPFFLALLDHLAQAGCKVPATIHDNQGQAFRMIAEKPAALIEFLPGVSCDFPSQAQARAVGAALASVHLATQSSAQASGLSRKNSLGPQGVRQFWMQYRNADGHAPDAPNASDAPDALDDPNASDAPDALDAPNAPDSPDAQDIPAGDAQNTAQNTAQNSAQNTAQNSAQKSALTAPDARHVDAAMEQVFTRWPAEDALTRSIIHADLFPDNVLLLEDQVSGLIDFYFAADDFCAYDLAMTHAAWCFSPGAEQFLPEISEALIQGYQQARPLSAAEAEALPLFAQGATLRIIATRCFDWINTPADALVTRKDPGDFLRRLRFYQTSGAEEFARAIEAT